MQGVEVLESSVMDNSDIAMTDAGFSAHMVHELDTPHEGKVATWRWVSNVSTSTMLFVQA